jgi:hypothetical protein
MTDRYSHWAGLSERLKKSWRRMLQHWKNS